MKNLTFLLLLLAICLCNVSYGQDARKEIAVQLKSTNRVADKVASYKVVECCWCTNCNCNLCGNAVMDTLSGYSVEDRSRFAVGGDRIKLFLYDTNGQLISEKILDLNTDKINKIDLKKNVEY